MSTPGSPQNSTSDDTTDALAEALLLAEPLVAWCVRRGVGHGQFSKALKLLFYDQALRELQRQDYKASDSAISMISGLHRGDVAAFKLASQVSEQGGEHDHAQSVRRSVLINSQRISPTHQVLARWLGSDLPLELPIRTSELAADGHAAPASFAALVQSVNRTTSQGFSPSLVLQEMQRQGLVQIQQERVQLLLTQPHHMRISDAEHHFVAAGRDFLLCVLSNLNRLDAPPYLEQSLDATELSAASVAQLQQEFYQWWQQALQKLLPLAAGLNEQDLRQAAASGEPAQRVRLGVYVYAEDMPQGSGKQQTINNIPINGAKQ